MSLPYKSLYELQQVLLAAVINSEVNIPGLDGENDDANLLDIHRNNWRSNLCNALRATYPVVERLVGSDFFAYAANGFIDAYPSRSGNLEDYGKEFAEFLRTFAAAQTVPYLADVAALEAAIEAVLVADDAVDLAYPLSSPFPILRIWWVNQPNWHGDDSVTLDEGADYLSVHRVGGDVIIEPIDAEGFNVLQNACVDCTP